MARAKKVFNFSKVEGKTFIYPKTKEPYGTIRTDENIDFKTRKLLTVWKSFAIDDCGNHFLISSKGRISFFNHETENIIQLANNFEDFSSNCINSDQIPTNDAEVISTWVNPDFANKQEINVPKDSKIK